MNCQSIKQIEENELETIKKESERIHRETMERESNERIEKYRNERMARADRDKALIALMGSRSIMEAARISGISRGTFYNLKKDADFMTAFNDLKAEQRDRLEDEFFELSKRAGEVITELFNTENNSYTTKINPVYKLKIQSALRVLEMTSRIHGAVIPENTETGITAKATLPPNTNGIAGAFVVAKNNPIESVQNCSGSV